MTDPTCFPASVAGELTCELPATGATWTPLLLAFSVLLIAAGSLTWALARWTL